MSGIAARSNGRCALLLLLAGSSIALPSIGAGPASAADLPAQLLAAARSMPADTEWRRKCLGIVRLSDVVRSDFGQGDGTGADASEPYTAATRGAYLGGGPAGAPVPPFVQALLDAGAARRLALPPAPRSSSGWPVSQEGEAYVVTGADSGFFAHDGDLLSPVPPAAPDGAGPPPGVWRTSHVCYPIVADRVLEHGDPVSNGNGVSQVSAMVLFRPERIPAWGADPRVSEHLLPPMAPLDFRLLSFRNDGDGWVAQPHQFTLLPARTHIVGADE